MHKYLKLAIQIILYPLYVIIVLIPYIVQYLIYLIEKRKIKIERKNCMFLVNPTSGKKLGRSILDILKDLTKNTDVVNILEENYVEAIKKKMETVEKSEYLYLVIAGGDGTVSSIVDKVEVLEKKEQIVFVPLPVGTGNDMSRNLGFGYNLNLHYVYQFFQRFNSKKCEVVKMDTWYFECKFHDGRPEIKNRFILYFGIGCDAKVVHYFSILRKHLPFIIQVTKINKLYFFFCWLVLFVKELISGTKANKLDNIKTTIDDKLVPIDKFGCVVMLSANVRQGFTDQWNTGLPANFTPQNISDGIFEFLSFDNYFHLGMVTSFVRKINRVTQGKSLELKVGQKEITIQTDGESCDLQGPMDIRVYSARQINVLRYIF